MVNRLIFAIGVHDVYYNFAFLVRARASVCVYLPIVLDLTFLTRTNARLEFRPKSNVCCTLPCIQSNSPSERGN